MFHRASVDEGGRALGQAKEPANDQVVSGSIDRKSFEKPGRQIVFSFHVVDFFIFQRVLASRAIQDVTRASKKLVLTEVSQRVLIVLRTQVRLDEIGFKSADELDSLPGAVEARTSRGGSQAADRE
jgi:hypothetical protein